MSNTIRKVVALALCMAFLFSNSSTVLAANEINTKGITFSVSLDNSELTSSSEAQTVIMTLEMSKSEGYKSFEYEIVCNDSIQVISVTGPSGSATSWNGKKVAWMSTAVATDTILSTIEFKIPADLTGTYELGVENIAVQESNSDNFWEDGASASATLTIKEAAASNDPYTANISTTDSEFTVNDPVAVTVNVGGTIGSFASSEVTLTYDSTYLTFNEGASTLNGAGVDLTTANTIKLVDHGDNNAYPAAYVLNFTAKQATTAATAVTLTDAKFSTAENAISSDLIDATGENALSLTIKNADLTVDLTNASAVTGNPTVPYGADYTFTAKNNTTYMYYDYEVTVMMGNTDVSASVTFSNGTWTVPNVTGNLVISVTETPKSYNVTVNGDSTVTAKEIAQVITSAVNGKATYNTALTYTLPAGQAPSGADNGYHYIATVTVGGTSYTASANGLTYTIAGTAVTGDIVITLSKVIDLADSVKVTIEGSNEIQKDGQFVTEVVVEKNGSVTLTLVPEVGYTYVINDGTKDLTINADNTFTVSVGETPITITVTKTLDKGSVNVQQYIQLNGTNMWLVTINGNGTTEIGGKTYSYKLAEDKTENFFWSSKYKAYCYLVVAPELSVDTAKAAIGEKLIEADAIDVEYNMDVNNTNGKIDANDAQLVYNMYQTKAYDNFGTVGMIKFLEADLNATVGVDSTDAQVIINKLLNKE